MAQKVQLPEQKEYCGHWDNASLARSLEFKLTLVKNMQRELKSLEREIFYIKWELREREVKKICAPEAVRAFDAELGPTQ